MLEASAGVSNGGLSANSSPILNGSGDSCEEELSVLPRHTKVVVTGNNRTKSVLVGLEGVVKKAVGLGGWHWLVLTNGIEVKLQRNALSVIEAPTGNEEDEDLEFDQVQWDSSDTVIETKNPKAGVRDSISNFSARGELRRIGDSTGNGVGRAQRRTRIRFRGEISRISGMPSPVYADEIFVNGQIWASATMNFAAIFTRIFHKQGNLCKPLIRSNRFRFTGPTGFLPVQTVFSRFWMSTAPVIHPDRNGCRFPVEPVAFHDFQKSQRSRHRTHRSFGSSNKALSRSPSCESPGVSVSTSKKPVVDLSKLEMAALWRYLMHFNLVDAIPNPSKEQLIDVVQRHFISQQLDELQVITGFVQAAKRLKTVCK
ncbi:histone deacetylase complex subunit SAP30 [Striga asiatica]|uniref:Histone deacetylase complex subunit SAP30 n=1 Tax=Striga asiatica TaxID=4170 RepID=A0A5A7PBF5_STRAF|nr:histone deacetylase complex subunit SAP30 [Striga asiatica]